MLEDIDQSQPVSSLKISFVFPAIIIAIIALPLFRLFPPFQVMLALIIWLIAAFMIVAVMLILKQGVLPSLIGVISGMMVTLALVGLVGLGRMDISPIEIREIFSVKPEINLSSNFALEAKESLFHSEIDQGARWSYRAFYVKVPEKVEARYFYVFQLSADGSIPTKIYPVPEWLWIFPV